MPETRGGRPPPPLPLFCGDVYAYVGTSGFSYPGWKGIFYPAKLPTKNMLAYYAERLPSVELNSTFYRLPAAATVAGWRAAAPESFRFAVKAPRRITHQAKLIGAEEALSGFVDLLAGFEVTLGPVLFQLPPTFAADQARLRDFVQALPPGLMAAFEFRHVSWFSDETLQTLESASCALVGGDPDRGELELPLERTAPFAYLRLRLPEYGARELESWAARISALGVDTCFAYFKHETGAPALARQLLGLLEAEPSEAAPEP